MKLKKLIVNKSSKDNEALEYSKEYNIIDKEHVNAYLGRELEMAVPGQERDLMCVRNLKLGSYTLDIGDHWLDVEVQK